MDKAEQAGIGQVELLVREPFGHDQPTVVQARRGDQGVGIGSEPLGNDALEGQAEGGLQNGQQRQHEEHGQKGRAEHQPQAQ